MRSQCLFRVLLAWSWSRAVSSTLTYSKFLISTYSTSHNHVLVPEIDISSDECITVYKDTWPFASLASSNLKILVFDSSISYRIFKLEIVTSDLHAIRCSGLPIFSSDAETRTGPGPWTSFPVVRSFGAHSPDCCRSQRPINLGINITGPRASNLTVRVSILVYLCPESRHV